MNQVMKANEAVTEEIKIGKTYAVLWSEDNFLYRGRVEEIRKSQNKMGNEYFVRFVDFGNTELVTRKDLRQLPDSVTLEKFPSQACRCRLRNLVTISNVYSLHESFEHFKNIFKQGLKLYAILYKLCNHTRFQEPQYEVDLSQSKEKLNEFFPPQNDEVCARGKDQKSVAAASSNKVSEWLMRTLSQPEPEIASLKIVEKEGARVECVIEHIVSPALFYIHLLDMNKYPGQQVLDLPRAMCHYFAKRTEELALLSVGQYVAVKDVESGGWLRGQIETVVDKSHVDVFLVDYGDKIQVKFQDVRSLPMEFRALPKYAVPVSYTHLTLPTIYSV